MRIRRPVGKPVFTGALLSPLINAISSRLVSNDEMQGARILRNEAYIRYAARTKDDAQRRSRVFSSLL